MIIHFAVPFAYTHISSSPTRSCATANDRGGIPAMTTTDASGNSNELEHLDSVQSALNFMQKIKEIFSVVWFGFAPGMMRIVRRRFSTVDKTHRENGATSRFVNITHLDLHSFPLVRLFPTSIRSKWIATGEDGARIKNDIISQLVKSINNAFTSKSFNVSTLNPVCGTTLCECVCVIRRHQSMNYYILAQETIFRRRATCWQTIWSLDVYPPTILFECL